MRRILLFFPLLFLLELVFGESGQWLLIGERRLIREVLFPLALLSLYIYAAYRLYTKTPVGTPDVVASRSSTPGRWPIRGFLVQGPAHLWKRLKFTKTDAAVLVFILVNTVWGSLVPVLYDQSLKLAATDFGTVYVLLFYFPLVALARSEEGFWERTRAIFTGAVLVLAILHIAVWAVVAWRPESATNIRQFLLELYKTPQLFVGFMPDGFFRVELVTSIFLLPVFFLLSRVLIESTRRLFPVLMLFVVSCALVVSYTRAFWIGILFGLVLLCVLPYPGGHPTIETRLARTRLTRRVGKAVLPALVFLAAFVVIGGVASVTDSASATKTDPASATKTDPASATKTDPASATKADPANTLDERLTSTVDARDESINIKIEQLSYLLEEWRSAPLFGKGFGTYVEEYVRSPSEKTPFLYEFTAPALLMKLGIVGSVLWLAPLVYVLIRGWRSARPSEANHILFSGAGFLSFALAVQTNPLLFNFVGMSVLLFYLVEFALVGLKESHKLDR